IKRWNLSERAFFGHGACHILAHAYMLRFPKSEFYAVWIKPDEEFRGNHVFVTNGIMAFDYRGYLTESRLTSYHQTQYEFAYPGWGAKMVRVEGNLCDAVEMQKIGMQIRGPNEFLHDAMPRACSYLNKYDDMHGYYVTL
ncbi:hypothetical protein N9850_05460, partial [Granulosicoccus sp.]